MNMKIKVMSLWKVQDFINNKEFNPDQKFAIITVTDSEVNFIELPLQMIAWLKVKVDDLEDGDKLPNKRSSIFDMDHANAIKNFVEHTLDVVDFFIIHCDAGMSRSPAVAAALSLVFNGDDSEFFKGKTPNRTVYRRMLEAFGLKNEPVFDLPENCKLCDEKLSNFSSTKLIGVHDKCLLKGEWK
jgi:predicted protein tyrosine phosphatase